MSAEKRRGMPSSARVRYFCGAALALLLASCASKEDGADDRSNSAQGDGDRDAAAGDPRASGGKRGSGGTGSGGQETTAAGGRAVDGSSGAGGVDSPAIEA